MTDPAADAARAAAILAPDLGPSLPAEVEANLAARDAAHLCVPRKPSTDLTSRVGLLSRLGVMIADHVPAVRLPPHHADDHVAAAVPA